MIFYAKVQSTQLFTASSDLVGRIDCFRNVLRFKTGNVVINLASVLEEAWILPFDKCVQRAL